MNDYQQALALRDEVVKTITDADQAIQAIDHSKDAKLPLYHEGPVMTCPVCTALLELRRLRQKLLTGKLIVSAP